MPKPAAVTSSASPIELVGSKAWHLLGDIGGSHARFGFTTPGALDVEHFATYQVSEYPNFADVLDQLHAAIRDRDMVAPYPAAICLAVAAPLHHDTIAFTNSSWLFNRELIRQRFRTSLVLIVNDFAAIARALPIIDSEHLLRIGSGQALAGGTRVAIGPGTGLGVAAVCQGPRGEPVVVSGEGGHIDFAPTTEIEDMILNRLRARHGRVSIERLCSGSGIANIYEALAKHRKQSPIYSIAPAIGAAALRGETVPMETMAIFFAVLGATAGNLALTFGASGGVYIAGGIVRRYVDLLISSEFRERFLAKGRLTAYLSEIPTMVVMNLEAGLLGANLLLEDQR